MGCTGVRVVWPQSCWDGTMADKMRLRLWSPAAPDRPEPESSEAQCWVQSFIDLSHCNNNNITKITTTTSLSSRPIWIQTLKLNRRGFEKRWVTETEPSGRSCTCWRTRVKWMRMMLAARQELSFITPSSVPLSCALSSSSPSLSFTENTPDYREDRHRLHILGLKIPIKQWTQSSWSAMSEEQKLR